MGIDIFFGIVLFIGAWRGYRRGFAEQMLLWAGLVVAFLFAEPIANWAAPKLGGKLTYFPEHLRPSVLYLAAIVVVWLAIYIAGSINLSVYRKRIYGENRPSRPDRILGFGMGAAQGALIVSLIAFLWVYVPQGIRESETVKKEYDASRGMKLAEEYRVVERVIDTEEVQRAWGHVRQIAEHYRSAQPKDTADGAVELRLRTN